MRQSEKYRETVFEWRNIFVFFLCAVISIFFWVVGTNEEGLVWLILVRIVTTAMAVLYAVFLPLFSVITPDEVAICYALGILRDAFGWKDVCSVQEKEESSHRKFFDDGYFYFQVSTRKPAKYFFMTRQLYKSSRLRHLILRHWGKPENRKSESRKK